MSQATIPDLPFNGSPPSTVLFEISNAGVSESTDLTSVVFGLQLVSEKDQPNGYAGLNSSGFLNLAQIPDLSGTYQILTEKDIANGYAGLDATALVLLGAIPQLPESRIDNLIADLAARELLANKVTVVGTPGNDTNYPTEKATRDALDLKQDTLLFTPEDVANKVITVGTPGNDTNYPSEKAVRDALDLKEDSLGFTPENIINKVTTVGNPGDDTNYPSEQAVREALDLKEDSLGFTPENIANKSINFTSPNDTKYPTTQAVVTELLNYQLLSGKGAVSGYAGLDASQELLIANFPSGTALQVLRRNAGNTALEFATAGANQTPWLSNIDADTFNLLDGGYAEMSDNVLTPKSDEGALRMPNGVGVFWRNSGDTGNNGFWADGDILTVQGFDEVEGTSLTYIDISSADVDVNSLTVATNLQMNGNPLEGGSYFEFDSIVSPGVTGLATRGRLFLDSGNANHLSVIRNGAVIDLETAGAPQTPWTSNIDGAGFALLDTNYIEVGSSLATPFADAGTIRMPDEGEIAWRNSGDDGNLIIYSTGDELNFEGFTTEVHDASGNIDYSSADEMDVSSAVVRVDTLEVGSHIFTTGTFADAGIIRLGNTDLVAWRNFANSANITLQVNASDQFAFNSVLTVGNNLIKAVLAPVDGTDAANKTYVDNLVNGLAWKDSAVVATTGNISLTGEQIIDTVLTSTSRVLVKDQTLGEDNGVYVSAAGAWARSTDADTDVELVNMSIFIEQGTVNIGTAWTQTTDLPITVGTTVLNYAQIGAGPSNPLTTKGDIFGYDTAGARIPVGTDDQILVANSAVALGVEWQDIPFPLIAKGDLFTFTTVNARLPVGITGQILSANAATGTGLEWINNDASPLTSKGDIYTFTTVNERLAVGSNGQVLQANAAQPTGLEWITLVGGDVVGPVSSTDNAIARFDLATGKIIQNSGVIINDTNTVTVPGPIVLTAQGTVPSGTETYFREVANDLIVNVNGANDIDFNFGTTNRIKFTTAGIDLLTNTLAQAVISSTSILNGTQVQTAALSYANGLKQVFNPSSANAGLNVGAQVDPDPSAPVNGDIYYNSTNNKFRAYENSVWVDMIGGGGSQTPWTSDIAAATFNLSNFGVLSFDTPATSDPGISDSISMQTGTFTNDMHLHVSSGTGEFHFFIGATSPADVIINNNSVSMDFKSLNGISGIRGNNDLKILDLVTLASTVNNLQISGATTGNGPLIESEGTDTNVDIRFSPKGFADGSVFIQSRALKISEINTPTAPGAGIAKFYPKNVGGRSHLFIQDDVGEVDLNLGGSGDVVGPGSSTDNAIAIFNLTTGKIIQQSGATAQPLLIDDNANLSGIRSLQPVASNSFPASSVAYFQYGNNGQGSLDFEWNVLTGNKFRWTIQGTQEYEFTATQFLTRDNNIIMSGGYQEWLEVTDPAAPGVQRGRLYVKDVAGRSHLFIRDDVGIVDIQSGGGDVSGPASSLNHSLAVFDGVTGKIIDEAGSAGFEIIVDVAGQPTLPRNLIFTSFAVAPPGATVGFIGNYSNAMTINGNTGVALHIQNVPKVNLTATDVLLADLNLRLGTGFAEFEEISTPALPAANGGRLYVKDVATETHLFFINSSGEDTDLTEHALQTPWQSDIDAARFNLENTGAIDFSLSGPLVTPASTQPYIAYDVGPVPDAMRINVPAARTIFFSVGGTDEMELTNAVLDLFGNNIDNVSIFTSNAGSPATTGVMRFGSSEEITWRNAANNGNNSIYFNASNEFQIEITNGADYTFSETEFDVAGNNIIAVEDLTMTGNLAFGVNGTLPGGVSAQIWWDGSAYMGHNVPNGDEYRFYINAIEQYSFNQTEADFFNNSIINAGVLNFDLAGSTALAATEPYINFDAGGLNVNVPTGDTIDFFVANVPSLQISVSTGINFTNTNAGIQWGGTNNRLIRNVAGGFDFRVETGDVFNFQIQGLTNYIFNATELDLLGRNITNVQNIVHDQSLITYNATLAFDFDEDQEQTLAVTGDLTTLTTSNRAAGKSKSIFITGDTVNRTLTFNTSWRTNPSTATVTITANTFGLLTFGSKGGAETDVFCAYAEFV